MITGTRHQGDGPPQQAADLYFERDGARLRYRDEGSGPAVLLVHGWTLDLDMWELQVCDLSRTFRVVRFDRRGFGLSSGHPGIVRDVADARALCRHLGLERVACIGMSQGARVVRDLAAAEPALASCLLLDGPPDLRPRGALTTDDVPLTEYRALVKAHGIEAFRRNWAGHPLAALRTQNEPAQRLLRAMLFRYPGTDLREPVPDTGAGADQAPLEELRVPTLVLNGQHDLESRRQAGRMLARALPCCEHVVIPDSGHLPNLDNPDAYNAAVRAFLERHATAHT
jgi:pimeloyl-ACP methyl ester carboxylesterase